MDVTERVPENQSAPPAAAIYVAGTASRARLAALGLPAQDWPGTSTHAGLLLIDASRWLATPEATLGSSADKTTWPVIIIADRPGQSAAVAERMGSSDFDFLELDSADAWLLRLIERRRRDLSQRAGSTLVGQSLDILRLQSAINAAKINAWAIDADSGAHFPGEFDQVLFGERIESAEQMLRGMADKDAWFVSQLEDIQAMARLKNAHHEYRRVDCHGQERWYSVHASCVFDAVGRAKGIVGITHEVTDRKRAEQEAERHSTMLSNALKAFGLVSWEYDVATRTRRSIGDDYALFGCSPADLAEFEALVLPEDRTPERYNKYLDSLARGEGYVSEFRIRRADDGEVRWLQTRGRPLFDANGELRAVTGIVFDLTDRKQIELKLAETEAWLARALSAGRMIAWEWDVRKRERRALGDHESLFGRRVLTVDDAEQLLHGADRELDERLFQDAVLEQKSYENEFRIRHGDGSLRWIRSLGTPVEVDEKGVVRMAGLAWDISERKSIELALRETEQRLRRALQAGRMVVWEWNLRTGERRSHGDSYELIGRGQEPIAIARERIHIEDRARNRALFDAAVKHNGEYRDEFRLVGDDGRISWVRSVGSPIAWDEQGVAVMSGVAWDITERKLTEIALRESEARLRAALDAAHMVSWEWNLKTGERHARGDEESIFGFAPGVNSHDVDALIHPDDYQRDQEAFALAILDRGPYRSEFRIRRPDGRERWLFSRGQVIREDAEGQAEVIAGVVWDITERKQIEQALAEREVDLRKALQAARMCRFRFDTETHRWRISGDLAMSFGVASDENFRVHPESRLDLARYLARLKRGRAPNDIELRIELEANTYWIELRANVLNDHEINGLFWDITLRKRFEQAFLESEHWHRMAVEGANLNVWEYDLETKVRRGGARDLEFFGSSPETLDDLLPIVHPDDRESVRAGFFEATVARDVYRTQYRVVRPDGCVRWLESIGRVQSRRDGTPMRIAGVSLDVTEKKEHAEALQRAVIAAEDAARAQSAFLAAMSHEIRTPMNAVIGMTGLLLGSPLDERQQEMARTLKASAELLLNLINDVLDFSKIDAGQMKLESAPFALAELIESTLALLAPQAELKKLSLGAVFDFDLDAELQGDPTRIRQILVNLLSNAIKFTPQGHVELRAQLRPAADDQVELAIAVRDQGIGIAAPVLATLFTPFKQGDSSMSRRFGGTGLGLVICKRLTDLMGGKIEVWSEPGQGACFTLRVCLPRIAGGERAGDAISGRRVAVLMDASNVRDSLIEQLALWGVSVDHHPKLADIRDLSALAAVIVDDDVPIPADFATPVLRILALGAPAPDARPALPRPIRPSALFGRLSEAINPFEGTKHFATTETEASAEEIWPLKILVAEDNDVNQMLIELMMDNLGFSVDLVADGGAAVEAVRSQDYNVVLMDVEMPGMDGLEATRLIRSEPTRATRPYIIAATAHVMADSRERFVAAGMNDYVPKPILIPELKAALKRAAEYLQKLA